MKHGVEKLPNQQYGKDLEMENSPEYAEERWPANETRDEKTVASITENQQRIHELKQKIDNIVNVVPTALPETGGKNERGTKKSSINRIAGELPEGRKRGILEKIEGVFIDQNKEASEQKKTPEELEIIDSVNRITNEILQKYGLESFDIPPENIHIVKKIKNGSLFYDDVSMIVHGLHSQESQNVRLQNQASLHGFAGTLFHEMLHFKSYGAGQVLKNSANKKLEYYRVGLHMQTRDGKKTLFENLNEAITEDMTKKYTNGLFMYPIFEKERKETLEETAKHPLGTFNDDEYYVHKRENKFINFLISLSGNPDPKAHYEVKAFYYAEERQTLNTLINKLFTHNHEKFKNEDEIMEMFERAMMTGHIHAIGQLIDKTFEHGTFRKIGELGGNTPRLKNFVNSL